MPWAPAIWQPRGDTLPTTPPPPLPNNNVIIIHVSMWTSSYASLVDIAQLQHKVFSFTLKHDTQAQFHNEEMKTNLWWCRSTSREGRRDGRGGACGGGWCGSPVGTPPSEAGRSTCATTCESGWWGSRRWPVQTSSSTRGSYGKSPLRKGNRGRMRQNSDVFFLFSWVSYF